MSTWEIQFLQQSATYSDQKKQGKFCVVDHCSEFCILQNVGPQYLELCKPVHARMICVPGDC